MLLMSVRTLLGFRARSDVRSRTRIQLAAVACVLSVLPASASAQSSDKSSGTAERAAARPSFKRLSPQTEEQLLRQLRRDAVEVDVRSANEFSSKLAEAGRQAVEEERRSRKSDPKKQGESLPAAVSPTLALIKQRADLLGLPLREGEECKKERGAARLMEQVSSKVQDTLRQYAPSGGGLAIRHADPYAVVPPLIKVASQYRGDHLTTLMQMFQPQASAVRLKLVELLATSDDPQSSALLSQRAIYDPSPDVRQAAVKALQKRPAAKFRPILVKGLRYPWAPVANHAAEALAALQDRDAVPELVALLDRPDPRRPYLDQDEQPVVAELVTINHLRNCQLCHAPSLNDFDPVRGVVPTPGRSLAPRYYEGDRQPAIFVRADIIYLQQDFSTFQPVPNADPWPAQQRFDYLIRARPLTEAENELWLQLPHGKQATYPQREAVLFALRELTGEERGKTAEDWRPLIAKNSSGNRRR